MVLATWKDLCLDAVDVEAQSRFWAAVTGLEERDDPTHRHLVGPTPRHTIWVNAVDRPHVTKNRLHLDLDSGPVEELVALGARVLSRPADTGFGWHVMADPEGNEFCAFERDEPPAVRLHGIGVDCVDPGRVARWWADVLGAEAVHDEGGWWTVAGVAADERMTLDFNAVPEPRTVPHRVHWDVTGDVEALLAAGAHRRWETEHWSVLGDPEGNEFCVFAPES